LRDTQAGAAGAGPGVALWTTAWTTAWGAADDGSEAVSMAYMLSRG
jgi:hypothetical protein